MVPAYTCCLKYLSVEPGKCSDDRLIQEYREKQREERKDDTPPGWTWLMCPRDQPCYAQYHLGPEVSASPQRLSQWESQQSPLPPYSPNLKNRNLYFNKIPRSWSLITIVLEYNPGAARDLFFRINNDNNNLLSTHTVPAVTLGPLHILSYRMLWWPSKVNIFTCFAEIITALKKAN